MVRQRKRKTVHPSLWSQLTKGLHCLGFLCLFLLFVALSVWLLGPRLYSFSSSKNILFYTIDKSGFVSNYHLAEYKQLPSENLFAVSPIELGERRSVFSSTAVASWQLGLIIDQLVELPATDKELSDLRQLRRTIRQQFWRQIKKNPAKSFALLRLLFTLRSLDSIQIEFKAKYQADLLTPLEAEGCALAVINSTDQTGLATQMAGLFERSGARVVRITDQEQAVEESALIYQVSSTEEGSCQLWAKRAQAVLPPKIQIKDDADLRQRQRADLIILLGRDVLREQL